MNETLKEAILTYATDPHKLPILFDGLSKPTLSSSLTDLLTIYFNDLDSSHLRALVTLLIAGYEPYNQKLGYNGYRQAAPNAQREECEVKPKNSYRRNDCKVKQKLNGGGSFNDYTPERLRKDKRKDPTMLVSGFAEGRLIYVLKFPFSCLYPILKSRVDTKWPNRNRKGWIRRKGDYLRGANFDFKAYYRRKKVVPIFLADELTSYSEYVNKKFHDWLLTRDVQVTPQSSHGSTAAQ